MNSGAGRSLSGVAATTSTRPSAQGAVARLRDGRPPRSRRTPRPAQHGEVLARARGRPQAQVREPGTDQAVAVRLSRVPYVDAGDGSGEVGPYPWLAQQFAEEEAQLFGPGAAQQQQRLGGDVVQHPAPGRVPLGVVAVQQPRPRGAPHLGGEFPAEVGGVLQPEVEGLAAHRHLVVGGVAREQDPAPAVLGHLPQGVAEGVQPQRGAGADVVARHPLPGRRHPGEGHGPRLVADGRPVLVHMTR